MGFRESLLAVAIASALRAFVTRSTLGLVTGEGGMMRLFAGLVRIPDVAYVAWNRLLGSLHLNPAWQRLVASRLTETFPSCQFVVSTHSPQVFDEVDAKCIRRLAVDPIHGLTATIPQQAFGLDSSEVLEQHMDTERRNRGIPIRESLPCCRSSWFFSGCHVYACCDGRRRS